MSPCVIEALTMDSGRYPTPRPALILTSCAPRDKSVLLDYIDTAEHLDFESGLPFSAPLTPEADAKLCIRRGYSQEDAGKPGWASIVISEKNL